MGLIRVGHRGAPEEFPGNTLKGFRRAVELGCAMVECDVRQAVDGLLVLAHDPYVKDINGKTFVIARETHADLARIDLGAGEGVPTLEALAAWAVGRCAVMADMKCEGNGVEADVVQLLARLSAKEKVVPGADAASRGRFRAIDPSMPLSLSIGCGDDGLQRFGGFDALLPAIDTDAVTWEHPLLDATRIAALHDRGMCVFAWTVDDLPTMQRLLSDGVDGLISNRPDLLATL